MSMGRVNIDIADLSMIIQQCFDNFLTSRWRKAPVRGETDDQKFGFNIGHGLTQMASKRFGWVKIVERSCDQ